MKMLKITGIIIDVIAVIFNLIMFGAYVYALYRGYKPQELDMEWCGVIHYVMINAAWSIKALIVKITKAIKSRKK